MKKKKQIVIYQSKTGAIELQLDLDKNKETLRLTQQQVADIFDVQKAAISKHVRNIFDSGELLEKSTVSKMETVQMEGKRMVGRIVEYYNLDLVLSIGYRVNSKKATAFRQWATKTLRAHIVDGYTINKKRIAQNYETFLKAVEDVKKLLPVGGAVDAGSALELVKLFANTWVSLDAYDKSTFPKSGATKKQVKLTSSDLSEALQKLKQELILKNEATELFGLERQRDSISGIVGNAFQAFGGSDVYPTVEEKAAHLLYFMVKNHPFVDGN
jgi:predicted XRE-type DNA-binding protein